ncbi:hypothetical protein FACS1894200_05200 [Spirochaetia bacterium]|nr:hypothetical protein FACS1894200_05200 [Spirochaetia bacterium]
MIQQTFRKTLELVNINFKNCLTFILVVGTSVEGAAYATVISQAAAGLACIPVIRKKLPILKITREDWHIDWAELKAHFRVALPMGFQMSIIAIGAVAVTFALNQLGTLAVAAFTTSQKIDMMCVLPLSSFGAALTTFAAQNYGAKKVERIQKGLIQCSFMSVAFGIAMGFLYFFCRSALLGVFHGQRTGRH